MLLTCWTVGVVAVPAAGESSGDPEELEWLSVCDTCSKKKNINEYTKLIKLN